MQDERETQEKTDSPASLPDGLPVGQRTPAVLAVLFCIAMASINVTLINIALPALARDLHVESEIAIYIISAYQLMLILFLLIASTLGDFFGYKQIFLAGIVVFTVASLGSGLSDSFVAVVTWRILQGLGAAAIQGSYLPLMTLIYPKQLLGRGMGLSTTLFALAAVSGPPVAAFILKYASWRYLFFINVPFGMTALVLGWRYLPFNVVKSSKCRIALSDAALHISTFGLFFVAASGWSHRPEQWAVNGGLTILCVLSALFYLRVQINKQTPLLPVDLFRRTSFCFPIVYFVLAFSATLATIVAVPFVLGSRFGYSAAQAGLLMTAFAGASIVSSMFAGFRLEKINPAFLCGIGFLALAFGAFSLFFLPEKPTSFDIVWRLGLCGIGSGFIQPANNFMAMNAVEPNRKGAASGVLTTSMMFGQILGMLLVTVLFSLAGNDQTLIPFALSGMIAFVGMIAVFHRKDARCPNLKVES